MVAVTRKLDILQIGHSFFQHSLLPYLRRGAEEMSRACDAGMKHMATFIGGSIIFL